MTTARTLRQRAKKKVARKHSKKDVRTKRVRMIRPERRIAPLVVTGVTYIENRVFKANELDLLNIDTEYQRHEIRAHVNNLIATIEAGGLIPDPISVARRKDGSFWIVDGQQRYWAHWHCEKPIRAEVYAVDDINGERQLFSVLNSQVRPNVNIRAMAWAGSGGGTLRWMNQSDASPLRGELQGRKYRAGVIARGLLAALGGGPEGGATASNKIEKVMQTLDHAVERSPTRVLKVAEQYSLVLRDLFDEHSRPVRTVQAISIGLLCYAHWKDVPLRNAWERPTGRSLNNIRRLNWDNAAPSNALRWAPAIAGELLRRWPVNGSEA